jgi:hypothetical protein
MYNNKAPKWREGSILVKDFYKLNLIEKKEYIESILLVPVEDRGDSDVYILHFFNKKKLNNFYSLE